MRGRTLSKIAPHPVSLRGALMAVGDVPPASWPAFLDSFSRQHQGWLVTITRNDAHVVSDEALDFARTADRDITVRAGDDDIRIDNANAIAVTAAGPDDSAIGHVAISSPRETLTIRFREVIPPELVDGVVP